MCLGHEHQSIVRVPHMRSKDTFRDSLRRTLWPVERPPQDGIVREEEGALNAVRRQHDDVAGRNATSAECSVGNCCPRIPPRKSKLSLLLGCPRAPPEEPWPAPGYAGTLSIPSRATSTPSTLPTPSQVIVPRWRSNRARLITTPRDL